MKEFVCTIKPPVTDKERDMCWSMLEMTSARKSFSEVGRLERVDVNGVTTLVMQCEPTGKPPKTHLQILHERFEKETKNGQV